MNKKGEWNITLIFLLFHYCQNHEHEVTKGRVLACQYWIVRIRIRVGLVKEGVEVEQLRD